MCVSVLIKKCTSPPTFHFDHGLRNQWWDEKEAKERRGETHGTEGSRERKGRMESEESKGRGRDKKKGKGREVPVFKYLAEDESKSRKPRIKGQGKEEEEEQYPDFPEDSF